MRVKDTIFLGYLLTKKLHRNTLINDVSHKTFMDAKPLHIRFSEIDRFIKIYDGIR